MEKNVKKMERAWCFLGHVGLIGPQFRLEWGSKKDWNWAGIELGLKEEGLGEMGRGCLLRFRTLFDVLAFISFTNVGLVQN